MKLWQRYVIFIFIVALSLFALIYLFDSDRKDSNDVDKKVDPREFGPYYSSEEIRFLQDQIKWKQQEM